MSRDRQNVLPGGWVSTDFGDVLAGSQNGCSARDGSGEPTIVLRLADVSSATGRIAEDGLRAIPLSPSDREKYALTQGDLLAFRVNGSKDITGRVVEYRGTEGFAYCDHFIRLKVDPRAVNPTFAAAAFGEHGVRQQIERNMVSSAGQNTVSQGTFRAVQFRLPPLNEQKRIVARIEALQARSDAAKEALDAVPPLLEKFRQSVLAAAFRGDLTKKWREAHPDVEPASELIRRIGAPPRPHRWASRSTRLQVGDAGLSVCNPETQVPRGWCWTALVDVAQLESGHTPSRNHPEYWNGEIPWVSIPDARDHHGREISQTLSTVTQAGLDNSAARVLPSRTVFLCRTAASIGYTLILGRPMATSQDFVAWVCNAALVPEYLMYLLQAEKQSLLRFAKGSTHRTIYFPEILSLHICLPPVDEQREIVSNIEARLSRVEGLRSAMRSIEAASQGLNQSIFAKAFRGELVPQDPNDEPAAVLLERIRQAREAAGGNREGRSKVPRARSGGTN
jgi:type I restriction enzyme S subunit